MPQKFSISKDDLKLAYSKFPEARHVLESLFPNLLVEDNKFFNFEKINPNFASNVFSNAGLPNLIQIRMDGNYSLKSFSLHPSFKWQIIEDEDGIKCLVPLII